TTQSNPSKQLESGIRAFILTEVPGDNFWGIVKNFLNNHPHEIISMVIQGKSSDRKVDATLRKNNLHDLVLDPAKAKDSWPLYETLIKENQRLVIFTPEGGNVSFSIARNICFSIPQNLMSSVAYKYFGNPLANLSTFHLQSFKNPLSDSTLRAPIVKYITTTGKIPNFIISSQPEKAARIAAGLDTIKRYQAMVLYNGNILERMYWKEFPSLESNGRIVIFPDLSNGLKSISPQKPGFRFSPDVISFNEENSKTPKIFQAIPLELKDRLIAHFDFSSGLKKQYPLATQDIIFHNVTVKRDPERGEVADFNGINSYIDCGQPRGYLFNESFTISLWIKPSRRDSLRSFVSLGTTFSSKEMFGSLVFTIPEVKDYISALQPIVKNKWQHVAFVFIPNQKMQFYYNGRLIDEFKVSSVRQSQHSLMIGDNMWDEFYAGSIDDVCIWDRALNESEIETVYKEGVGDENNVAFYAYLLFLLIPLSIAVFYFFRKKKRRVKRAGAKVSSPIPANGHSFKELVAPAVQPLNDKIILFGDFYLYNASGEDLASRFSPKKLQLFILILLYTFKNGKGITSQQMTDILWSGYSSESAKNNRSTNIQKTREILAENTGLSIEFSDRSWFIRINDNIECDYKIYKDLKNIIDQKIKLNEPIPELQLNLLLEILSQGPLLPNLQCEWIDSFKNENTEEVIDLLLNLIKCEPCKDDHNIMVRIVDILFAFDPVNEEALKIKISILTSQGKHKPALDLYDHFCKTYRNLYNEEYKIEFKNLI
ncbi:MAG: LamG-like jellyroll fold domain-containing protein, partial [Bacteroidota bacterium]|nr:LamG-like jellyroll fold domain-containing protein [Bacteroidota bacterium]